MWQTILATVVGGLLASIVPVVGLIAENNWRYKSNQISYLKKRKSDCQKRFTEVKKKLLDGLENDYYDADALFEVIYNFPPNVSQAIENFMLDKDRSKENRKKHYHCILEEYQKAIAAIDGSLEKTIKLRKR